MATNQLTDAQRAQLDQIVLRMTKEGRDPSTIKAVVADFRTRTTAAPETPAQPASELDRLPSAAQSLGVMAAQPFAGAAVRTAGRAIDVGARKLLPMVAGGVGASTGAGITAGFGMPFLGASMGSRIGHAAARVAGAPIAAGGRLLTQLGGAASQTAPAAAQAASGAAPAAAEGGSLILSPLAAQTSAQLARIAKLQASEKGMLSAAGRAAEAFPKTAQSVVAGPAARVAEAASEAAPAAPGIIGRAAGAFGRGLGKAIPVAGTALTIIDAIRNYEQYQKERAAWEAEASAAARRAGLLK